MTHSEGDHSGFFRHLSVWCIYVVIYVNDIVLTSSDHHDISQIKQHICHYFQTKYLGKLKYFLGIEVAYSNNDIIISQKKYALDILEETKLINSKSMDTLMGCNVKLLPSQGSLSQIMRNTKN